MKETIRKSKRNNHKRSIIFFQPYHILSAFCQFISPTYMIQEQCFIMYTYNKEYKIIYFSMFMNGKLFAFFVVVCTCRYEPVICEKYTILILIEHQHENMATQAVKTKSVLLPVFVIRINLILERLKSSGGWAGRCLNAPSLSTWIPLPQSTEYAKCSHLWWTR